METVPKRAAIVWTNRYMVEHSDYLIAYAWHSASNARDLVESAHKLEKGGGSEVTLFDKLWLQHCKTRQIIVYYF